VLDVRSLSFGSMEKLGESIFMCLQAAAERRSVWCCEQLW
jgi:hypothetical protein